MLIPSEVLKNLDPETRERFEKGEMDVEEMKNLGLFPDDYGEEGEAEFEEPSDDGDEENEDEDGEQPKKA